jgi:lipoprotein-releasing system ATP-binding protein
VPTSATIVDYQREPSGSAAGSNGAILHAQNLHRILGSGDTATHILKGVNLSISQREYVSIVGPSGSGKSTLLYLLGGLDRPTPRDLEESEFLPSSRVFIDGRDTTELNDRELALLRNKKIGFVFQFHYLLKEFTAQENIALPIFKLGKLSRDDAMARAAALLKQFNLADKARRKANRLSGGEQQRVSIARALANEPAVLLADEPTGNLDRRNGELVAEIFAGLASAGQTIVMVTHDMALAERARRIVHMDDGLISSDSAQTISPA